MLGRGYYGEQLLLQQSHALTQVGQGPKLRPPERGLLHVRNTHGVSLPIVG
jgi:hypothetical protein